MNSITFPLKQHMQGSTIADLQDALQACLDRSALLANDETTRRDLSAALKRERVASTYGDATTKLVSSFQSERRLQASGEVDEPTATGLNALLKQWGLLDQPPQPPPTEYHVEGKVVSRVSAGVGGLRVVIVDKGVGGDVQLAQATTDERGSYQASFSDDDVRRRGKTQPDLQARAFAGDTFLGASEVRYNASEKETLNILLDDNTALALRSEVEVLRSAIASQYKGNIRDLKETEAQQDITYLANKTGWDARAVALVALADQFSSRTADPSGTPAIPQESFYALFRAGLPANEDTIYHTDANTLKAVWTQASAQGVIPKASDEQISNLIVRFETVSAQKMLTSAALIGASSLKEMLTVSRLNDAQQARFAQLYAANRADMPAFWKAVGGAFGQDVASRLQVDGKLGFLTINNAPLMQKIAAAGANGVSDPLQLAQVGYHRPERWSQLLTADVPIPKEIPGDGESKRANYAEFLAAQVRLSYPTAAVAQMVKSGELPLTGAAKGISDQVNAFLTEHQGKFEIGIEPVERYIAQNKLQVDGEVVKQVKRLQRVYQITPSDQAMVGLMKRDIDAAYHVVRHDKKTFVQSFAGDLGGAEQAALVYDRSVQVHNTVLNVALSYLNARTAPAIGVHSPAGFLDPTPANVGDVIAGATLESLFGSMDFCACDHCRSLLSPAAYLVDLLLFLGSDAKVWAETLNPWKQNHDNAPYPFVNQSDWTKFKTTWNNQHPGQPLPKTEISPFDVLMSRRPDIQHLPLTCENTNTALPYIDVVNETLEYYVANGLSLEQGLPDEYHGYDTNDVASEDLLANPEFVMDSAYVILGSQRFPTSLPFHQPLENLRRYFNKCEVPLQLAMERLLKTDDLERGANGYGWRDILMEELGFSRAEYEVLSDSTTVPLSQMYGFSSGKPDNDVIAGLSNAKEFARRVGISYEDLVLILRTRFINPNSDLIPKLEQLGVPFAVLAQVKNNDESTFDALVAQLAVPPAEAEYGGDIKAWIKNDANYGRIMGLITLAIPTSTWVASKAYANGDCVRSIGAKAESTLYYECTTAGKSANSEPIWPTSPGEKTDHPPDGTVVWTCRDASSCSSFDNLAFRYSDPAKIAQNLGPAEFVRLLRFVRLWRKLGWTIEQTDAAICALFRLDQAPLEPADIDTVAKLDAGFLTLLPRLGVVKRAMRALNLRPKRDLLQLLACFAPIDTHDGMEWLIDDDQGRNIQTIPSLYRQLFLNAAILKQDPVFMDNGYGQYLQRAEVPYVHSHTTLEQPIVNAAQGRIGYDDSSKRLYYAGVLDAATRDALKSVPGVSPDFQQAVDGLYRIQRLGTHAEALRSALNLTSDEYDLIVGALHYDDSTALTIPNISAVFRRGWLARKLKLSVRELLLLVQFTGLDPFALIDPAEPGMSHVIELVQSMKDRSFKSTEALYLIWNQDLSGKSAPNLAQIAELARTLRGDFADIDDQFAATEDPNGDVARARVTLVYGNETSDAFFSFLDDTVEVDVAYTHPAPVLETAIASADPRIAYDDFRHRLSHKGLLTTKMQSDLQTAAKNVNGAGNFDSAVATLLAESEDAKDSFFTRNPDLEPAYEQVAGMDQTLVQHVDYTQPTASLEPAIMTADPRITYNSAKHTLSYAGVLTAARRDVLTTIPGVSLEFQSAVDALFSLSERSRSVEVLAALQPELSRARKSQQALERLSAAAGVSLEFTKVMLDPTIDPTKAHYPLHSADLSKAPENLTKPALNDVLALETPGLAAQFFFRDTATGSVDQSVPAVAPLSYDSAGGNPLPNQGKPISGVWMGQVETPEAGYYNLIIEADSGATVTVRLDGLGLDLTMNGNIWRNKDACELKAGVLHDIELKVEKVQNVLRLKWETPKRPREVIPSRYLYPPSILGPFSANYVRFLKAASLAMGLGLTANELAHFATHADYQIAGDGWLNALAASGSPPPATATALLRPFEGLLDFARIKADISPNDESLLNVLKAPAAAAQNADSLLFTITGWNVTSLNNALGHFGGDIAGFAHFDLFNRVYDAFAVLQNIGISASALIDATTNKPTPDTVRNFQAALRARYDAASWRDVVRPINDEMRSLQRDALVAYILYQMHSHPDSAHIDTPDKLFEFFLMDVQMDPCMQTSRIRHALSSVQLFIDRCLMNLEPRASSQAINAKQWEWMKRYRVWEANRKVFLFPENWLEPELRDDKSPFFKEIESELLQSDITEDSAATALLNYLSKLEEVAKLEPCGIYRVEGDPVSGPPDIDHVIARTAGAHRKYYYRRNEGGSWTPWEQIKLEIEDNPLVPMVWKGRLFLFWLKILKEVPFSKQNFGDAQKVTEIPVQNISTGPSNITVKTVLCWSEYYNGKWQSTKTSDVNRPNKLGDFPSVGESAFDRSKMTVLAIEGTSGALLVDVEYLGSHAYFLLYNTHSLPLYLEDDARGDMQTTWSEGNGYQQALPDTSTELLTISYHDVAGAPFSIGQISGLSTVPHPLEFKRQLLKAPRPDWTIKAELALKNAWTAPFFYWDSHHVFYITTMEQPVWIPEFSNYGLLSAAGSGQLATIPPLVLKIDPEVLVKPRPWSDGGPIGSSIVDRMAIKQFVTEDAYIRKGIGATSVVTYGDHQIGPSGTIVDVQAAK
jgi:hypothetical protein